MNRQELIKLLCTDISDHTSTSDESNELLRKLLLGTLSVDECYNQYTTLVTSIDKLYFINKYKDKPLGKSLNKFANHKLSVLQVAKLLSSLITHSLIETESSTSRSSDTGISQILIMLNKIVLSNYSNDYYDEVYKVLDKYNYILHK